MLKIINEDFFWHDESDEKSRVFHVVPDVYADGRGKFTEIWKRGADKHWSFRKNWVRQINTSFSIPGVIRGCHAQSGKYCQAKMVYAMERDIFDIITDARPQSKTFGMTKTFTLSATAMNKLFVPRGFLHAVFIPKKENEDGSQAILTYMCDNVFNKDSEVKVNPTYVTKMLDVERNLPKNELEEIVAAKQDLDGKKMEDFLSAIYFNYKKNKVNWYEA